METGADRQSEQNPDKPGPQPTCLVATLGNASRLQRIVRLICVFRLHGYEIDLLGPTPERHIDVRQVIRLDEEQKTRRRRVRWINRVKQALATLSPWPNSFEKHLVRRWQTNKGLQKLSQRSYDVVVIEEIELFPTVLAAVNSDRTFWICELRDFDWHTHGFDVRAKMSDLRRRKLYRKFLPKADHNITVSNEQRQDLVNRLSIGSQVIRSLPTRRDISPSPVNENRISLVYHGKVLVT